MDRTVLILGRHRCRACFKERRDIEAAFSLRAAVGTLFYVLPTAERKNPFRTTADSVAVRPKRLELSQGDVDTNSRAMPRLNTTVNPPGLCCTPLTPSRRRFQNTENFCLQPPFLFPLSRDAVSTNSGVAALNRMSLSISSEDTRNSLRGRAPELRFCLDGHMTCWNTSWSAFGRSGVHCSVELTSVPS